jgi:hypothetical protein
LGVDQLRDFERGFLVKIEGSFVGLFGAEAAERGLDASWFQVWAFRKSLTTKDTK